tara:strand:+ start:52 stop:993 length:942 start_codon:yes stop_codon:yes gene_type:complete
MQNVRTFDEIVSNKKTYNLKELDYNHHSPSQYYLTDDAYVWRYFKCNQAIRRQFEVGPQAILGAGVGNAISRTWADVIWTFASKKIINKKQSLLESAAEMHVELKEADLDYTDKQLDTHNKYKKVANDMLVNLNKAVKSLSLQGEIEAEANRYYNFNAEIDTLGRTDLENNTCVVEIKTLPPKINPIKKDGTRSITTQKLHTPKLAHARQLSFYWAATKKKPFLVYVNEEQHYIFEPGNCDLLTVAAMEDHLEHYAQITRRREQLLRIAEGNVDVLLSLVEPKFDNFLWNIGDKFKEMAIKDFNAANRRINAN